MVATAQARAALALEIGVQQEIDVLNFCASHSSCNKVCSVSHATCLPKGRSGLGRVRATAPRDSTVGQDNPGCCRGPGGNLLPISSPLLFPRSI